MSQYIYFFLRSKTEMLPIYSGSRSSIIYQFFEEYAPYERVRSLNSVIIQELERDIRDNKNEINNRIKEDREKLNLIATFNNSVEEKEEAISSVFNSISCYEEELDEANKLSGFIDILKDIYEEADNTKWEDETYRIDPEKYIYFGIECGQPSIEEVENWENQK